MLQEKAAPTLDFRRRHAAQAFSIKVRLDFAADRGTKREPLIFISPFRGVLADGWWCAGRSAGGFPAADMGKRLPPRPYNAACLRRREIGGFPPKGRTYIICRVRERKRGSIAF